MKLIKKVETRHGVIAALATEDSGVCAYCLNLDIVHCGDDPDEVIRTCERLCDMWTEYGDLRRWDVESARRISPLKYWEVAEEEPQIPLWMD